MHVQDAILWKLSATETELQRLSGNGPEDGLRRQLLERYLEHLHLDLREARMRRSWVMLDWPVPAASAWLGAAVLLVAPALVGFFVFGVSVSPLHLGVFPALLGSGFAVFRTHRAAEIDRSRSLEHAPPMQDALPSPRKAITQPGGPIPGANVQPPSVDPNTRRE